ncbi:MAG: SMP-30/gluconolactonase/LRE family protein [Planctomycetota bacterium]|nr:SMP-30/gluconolactonase/LRE family protein [Planctomycetota bacterium]
MKTPLRIWLVISFISLGLTPMARGQAGPLPSTVADGAKLVSIYSDPRFFEGPVWDNVSGKLYFTAFGKEKTDTQILRLDAPGKVTVWADKTEGVNGMALGNDGRLIGAQAFGHRIVSYQIGHDGPVDPRVLLFNDKLHQPNDVAQAPNGDIYFTDPDFDKQKTSAVYLLLADGKVKKIIEDMQVTNGLKVSNDGRWLYVADDGPMNWRAYPILADGTVGPGTLFFDPPVAADKRTAPDGFTIDQNGTLYLSGSGGVWVVDRFGRSLGLIPIPEFCSNVAFGGDDGKTLFMTCDKQVYSLKMKVRGGQFTRTNKDRAVAAAAAPPKPAYELQEALEYGTAGDEKLTLHLARPTTGAGPFPVVVFIHGGGWAGGNKDVHKNEIIEAAKRGYVSISVGYRLAPKHRFPAQVEDVKCAVRWLRAHAKELNIRADKIGAVGFSAGAHLAMMLGTMDKGDGLEGNGGWADQSSKVQAVVETCSPIIRRSRRES